MFELTGKTALVTGSSRGIGRAVALKLAKAGAKVILHGRNRSEALTETARLIKNSCMVTGDTSRKEDIDAMFEKISGELGRLDILVNNAAVLTRAPFLELSYEDWNTVMETNVRGYFLCAQRAAKMMAQSGGGRIVNISSISQFTAAAGRTHYCASKGAIGMLTKGMALELAPYNITVNAILPGSVHTDFSDDVLSDKAFYKQCVGGIPLGRIGRPEDIGGAAVMLASDEASYISGAFLTIDGGKTL